MSAQYSAIAAKLKAMYAKSVSDAEMAQLTEKRTVGEICSYLKSTEAYGDVLAGVDENNAHRGTMEMLMREKLAEDFFRIYKFSDRRFMSVTDFVFRRWEADFLKDAIHYVYTGDERSSEKNTGTGIIDEFFENHTKIEKDKIRNAKTLEDCLEACRKTKYAQPLQRAVNLNGDFFTTGMLLDNHYFRLMWKDIHSKIPSSQAEDIKKLIGSVIEMLNLMWIYRGKKYFDFENEMIFTYILNIQYRLNRDTIRQLVGTQSVEAFLDAVGKTPYAKLFKGVEDGVFPEENYQYLVYKNAKQVFRLKTDSPAAILAYDRLKSYEIWRITTIIEGVRYSVSPDVIKSHIKLEI